MKNLFKGIILLMILTFVFAGCGLPQKLTDDSAEEVSRNITKVTYCGTVRAVDSGGNSIIVQPDNEDEQIKHLVTPRTEIYLNWIRVSVKKLKPGDDIKLNYITNRWNQAIYMLAWR